MKLTRNGYAVPRTHLEEIKSKYTVKAVAPPIGRPPDPFKVYRVGNEYAYIPKHAGLQDYGVPDEVCIGKGEPVSLEFEGSLRPEQETAKQRYMNHARDPKHLGGILNLHTGAGKTVLALNIIAELSVKTVIIVHKEFLMNQWIERINQFLPGATVGRIQGQTRTDGDIVLCMLQTLCVSKKYTADDFAAFGLVVIDECHHMGAEVFSRALYIANCYYSMGLSATVKRKDGLSKVFHWHLGDVVYTSPAVTDTNVHVTRLSFHDDAKEYCGEQYVYGTQVAVARMLSAICRFEPRTRYVVDELLRAMRDRPGSKALVLSERRSHLNDLNAFLTGSEYSVGFYVGGLKDTELKDSESKDILLGTYSMCSEGFDVPSLDLLVLATPKSDVEQAVGRILRKKPSDRIRPPLVIDVVDAFGVFANQARKRESFYRKRGYTVTNRGLEPAPKLKLEGKPLFVF